VTTEISETSVENVAYETRKAVNSEEKARIGRAVAAQIPDRTSLFINIGTTTEQVARALLGHKGMRVITNNLHVASILSPNPDFEVIAAGGIVRSRDQGIVGETAIDFIHQFHLEFGVIGISGIDESGALLDFDYREVRVAQAIIERSRQVFLAADHSKFGRLAMVQLGHVSQLDALFTDRMPPDPWRSILEEAGVTVHVAADKL
jgi:DeoR family glycerol-3-phosphate regulon repressor